MSEAERIGGLYRRHAEAWARDRGDRLIEKSWLERFLKLLPPDASILDIGCDSGKSIAKYFIDRVCRVAGIDSSLEMIAMCRNAFPESEWHIGFMRTLALPRTFDGILAWDSSFHLTYDDQRRMFPVFRRHAAPHAALMFSSGPRHGEAIGSNGVSRFITPAWILPSTATC